MPPSQKRLAKNFGLSVSAMSCLWHATGMWYPMHLHGHSFALRDGTGPRNDTVIVCPARP